jgi:hypothetical protein
MSFLHRQRVDKSGVSDNWCHACQLLVDYDLAVKLTSGLLRSGRGWRRPDSTVSAEVKLTSGLLRSGRGWRRPDSTVSAEVKPSHYDEMTTFRCLKLSLSKQIVI